MPCTTATGGTAIIAIMKKPPRKRPCSVCGQLFRPDPRVRGRQRTCLDPGCQQELHRQTCAAWHDRNPEWDRETRLRKTLLKDGPALAAGADPTGRFNWERARDEMGGQPAAVIEELAKYLVGWVRDEIRREALKNKG